VPEAEIGRETDQADHEDAGEHPLGAEGLHP
jgi:hypothetical protein